MKDQGRRPVHTDSIYNLLRCKTDEIAEQMRMVSPYLFRFDTGSFLLDHSFWEACIRHWIRKKTFPSIYGARKKPVYDPREVVMAVSMAVHCPLNEMDDALIQISRENNSFFVRPLYALHYKEGFWRMLLAWNEAHGFALSLEETFSLLRRYEKDLIADVIREGKTLYSDWEGTGTDMKNLHASGKEGVEALAGRMAYYRELRLQVQPFFEREYDLEKGLSFQDQDTLQRLIVITAHEKRIKEELEKQDFQKARTQMDDILERNARTRPLKARGTRYMMSVEEACSRKDSAEEASLEYRKQAAVQIGESYWRASSWMLECFSKSGEDNSSDFVRMPEGQKGKQPKSIAFFPYDRTDRKPVSFSLDQEELRSYVVSGSRNALLTAQLMAPAFRADTTLFCRQSGVGERTEQGTQYRLLTAYQRWMEGEETQFVQGTQRCLPPYFFFRRDDLIRFAFASGCRTLRELQDLLSLTGNEELDRFSPVENLTAEAFRRAESIPYRKRGKDLMICTVLDLQQERLLQAAADCLGMEQPDWFDEAKRERFIDNALKQYRKSRLYDPVIPAFKEKRSGESSDGGRESSRSIHQADDRETTEAYPLLKEYDTLHLLIWMSLLSSVKVLSRETEPFGNHAMTDAEAYDFLSRWFYCNSGERITKGFLLYLGQEEGMEEYLNEVKEEFLMEWERSGEYREEENAEIEQTERAEDSKEGFLEDLLYLSVYDEIEKAMQKHGSFLLCPPMCNASDLKYLYELWMLERAARRLVRERAGVNKQSRTTYEVEERLHLAAAVWIASGGAENIRLSYYERSYRLNHFRSSDVRNNGLLGPSHKIDWESRSRWGRYRNELYEEKDMWEEVSMDLKLYEENLIYCSDYIRNTGWLTEKQKNRAAENMKEIIEAVFEMKGDEEEGIGNMIAARKNGMLIKWTAIADSARRILLELEDL